LSNLGASGACQALADTVNPVPTAENCRAYSRTTGQILIIAYLNP
jgi:hypothetical protein